MGYIIVTLIAFATGAALAFILLESKRKRIQQASDAIDAQKQQMSERERQLADTRRKVDEAMDDVARRNRAVEEQLAKVVTYDELQKENTFLKGDLHSLTINLRKLEMDRDQTRGRQAHMDERANELGQRYLKEQVRWIGSSLNPNNFAACKERLVKAIQACRDIGLNITEADERMRIGELQAEYERVVRAAIEREEQARIKARIREEQRLEREIQREKERLERERAAIQAALDIVLADAMDKHSAEIEGLKARLAEAEERSRAVSQAQLTKAGYVYVISNIGSFGEGVYKIGMTRRLEPLDRIKELGDASVPFPFDIHMMISAENAPQLENALHREFHRQRLNHCNPRKEFFRVDLDSVARLVRATHGEIEYVADAEALQYRQSLTMRKEDMDYIESVYERFDDDAEDANESTDALV